MRKFLKMGFPRAPTALYCCNSSIINPKTSLFPNVFALSTIVGYLSKNFGKNSWKIVAASFESVGGAAGSAKINDCIKTDATPVSKDNMASAAQVLIKQSVGYKYLYYLSDATDEDALQAALDTNDEYLQALDNAENDVDPGEDYWWKEVDRITEEIKPNYQGVGWADEFGSLKKGSITDAGFGFWLMLPVGSMPATATFAHP